jgi:hypothetical protein
VKLPVFSLLTPTLLHNDQKVYFAVHFQYLHPLRNQGNTEKLLKNRSAIDFFFIGSEGMYENSPLFGFRVLYGLGRARLSHKSFSKSECRLFGRLFILHISRLFRGVRNYKYSYNPLPKQSEVRQHS